MVVWQSFERQGIGHLLLIRMIWKERSLILKQVCFHSSNVCGVRCERTLWIHTQPLSVDFSSIQLLSDQLTAAVQIFSCLSVVIARTLISCSSYREVHFQICNWKSDPTMAYQASIRYSSRFDYYSNIDPFNECSVERNIQWSVREFGALFSDLRVSFQRQ